MLACLSSSAAAVKLRHRITKASKPRDRLLLLLLSLLLNELVFSLHALQQIACVRSQRPALSGLGPLVTQTRQNRGVVGIVATGRDRAPGRSMPRLRILP
jgi:hypothetical protein